MSDLNATLAEGVRHHHAGDLARAEQLYRQVLQAEPESDDRLRKILPRLHALFRYTDYTTLDRQRVEGPLGTQQRFAVPGERWLEVTPDELHGSSVRMRVRLLRGEQPEMKAAILAAPGAPAVLGGPPYGNGVLIIILWANPNP